MTTEPGVPQSRVANYVVAYEATDRGREAIELGVALARLTGAELRICLVLPVSTAIPAKVPAQAADFDGLLRTQGQEWLDEELGRLPADVVATTHLLWAESTAEGVLEAALEFDTDRIIVGAARGGILNRFSIGSVANTLLHAAHVPVALAPKGYRAPTRITRITCAVGTRPGWQHLLDSMVAISADISVDLRFVTLVEVGATHTPETHQASEAHLAQVLDYFSSRATTIGPDGSPGGEKVTTEVAEGSSLETAVEDLDWRPDEIALVGSSRLAQPSRIFLGVTAHRMLHALPVPLIVVSTPTT